MPDWACHLFLGKTTACALFALNRTTLHERITGYQPRIPEQKQSAVAALKLLNYHVISAGDSYNDTAMLSEAHVGFLIHAPENVKKQFLQFKPVESNAELLTEIRNAMAI